MDFDGMASFFKLAAIGGLVLVALFVGTVIYAVFEFSNQFGACNAV